MGWASRIRHLLHASANSLPTHRRDARLSIERITTECICSVMIWCRDESAFEQAGFTPRAMPVMAPSRVPRGRINTR